MNCARTRLGLLPVVGGLLALVGCMGPMGWMIAEARTWPPPATLDEAGSFGWYAAWGMAQADLGR